MRSKNKKLTIERADELPVTQKLFNGLREEMNSKFISLEYKMDAGFKAVDARFQSFEAKFQAFEAKFQSLDSKFLAIDSKFHDLDSKIHRILVLVEEQNARNAVVFDGLTSLFGRQDRIEARVDELEKQ